MRFWQLNPSCSQPYAMVHGGIFRQVSKGLETELCGVWLSVFKILHSHLLGSSVEVSILLWHCPSDVS